VSMYRSFLFALLVGMPAVAGAQFTTFIPPRNKVADSVKAAVVAAQKTQEDSVSHAQIANMKTWVDSAAGLAPVPMMAADSVAQATTVATTDTTTFRNGSRAPATASALPLLAAVGAAALLLGALLLGSGARSRDGDPAAVRIRARDS